MYCFLIQIWNQDYTELGNYATIDKKVENYE